MPAHRLTRSAVTRIPALLRGPAMVLAFALLVCGCGGSDATPEADTPPTSTLDGDPEDGPEGGPEDGPEDGSDNSSEDVPQDEEPAPDPGYQSPRIGQCHRMTEAQSRASVAAGRRVSCSRQHTSVVAHVGSVPRPVTPRTPLAKRRALGARVCAPAYRRVVGGTLADRATSILTWTMFTPGQNQLERGARWIRCDVIARSGNHLVDLPPGEPLLKQGVPEPLRICQDASGADISCALPHSYRVAAVYRAPESAYPDPATYTPVARSRCRELTGVFGGFWQPPSREGWAAGDRFIRCLSPEPAGGQAEAP